MSDLRIGEILTVNSKPYRGTIRDLRLAASKIRDDLRKKYDEKLVHLRDKYRIKKDDLLRQVPKGLEDFADLSVFHPDKYDKVETESYDVKVIGNIEINDDEMSVLRLHPKFAVIEDLEAGGIEFDQELAFAKTRIQISKELEEMIDDENGEAQQHEMTEEDRKKDAELEAKSRQIFDPVERVFDDRKRRVTDLKECSRVTLPKPLPPEEEAKLEMRRQTQQRIYDAYRRANCKNGGKQRSNLTDSEQSGLKSLMKRITAREIIVMKSDKSSRFIVTDEENYRAMGMAHTGKDRKVDRREINEIEKTLNAHCHAWGKMWNSGQDHGHGSRIITSKTSKSENSSDMYLLYKDHKQEDGKVRPVVTGCTSDTLGMSNNVSDLLESVANSEPAPFEVVSTEDMLAETKIYNEKQKMQQEEWNVRRVRKIKCKKCCIESKICCLGRWTDHETSYRSPKSCEEITCRDPEEINSEAGVDAGEIVNEESNAAELQAANGDEDETVSSQDEISYRSNLDEEITY